MNESFNFKRFARLFIKHTTEHYRTYLMAIGVLTGVLVLCGVFLVLLDPDMPDPGFQSGSYMILMFVSGGIFTSTVFADYGEKNRAIPALTLPASALEKFLVGWVYSYPIFLVIYTAVYYMAIFALASVRPTVAGHPFQMFSIRQTELRVFWVLFTEIHSLSLFGAIFFKKLQFIKTGFIFFICLAIGTFCNTLLLKVITGAAVEKMAVPFTFLNFNIGNKYYSIGTNDDQSAFVMGLFVAVAVIGWVAAYYRLKEKQV
jgi:hypothetical protein